jgi:hypothetical protein
MLVEGETNSGRVQPSADTRSLRFDPPGQIWAAAVLLLVLVVAATAGCWAVWPGPVTEWALIVLCVGLAASLVIISVVHSWRDIPIFILGSFSFLYFAVLRPIFFVLLALFCLALALGALYWMVHFVRWSWYH